MQCIRHILWQVDRFLFEAIKNPRLGWDDTPRASSCLAGCWSKDDGAILLKTFTCTTNCYAFTARFQLIATSHEERGAGNCPPDPHWTRCTLHNSCQQWRKWCGWSAAVEERGKRNENKMGFHLSLLGRWVTIDQPFASKYIDVVVQRMQKYTERRTFHTPKLPTIRPGYGTAKLKARWVTKYLPQIGPSH